MSDKNCCICDESLLVPATDESDAFLDDIQLLCSHHVHWSCFADYDRQGDRSVCPFCQRPVLTNGKLLVTYSNEGGSTHHYDLGEELDEEKFLDEHPRLKLERAFRTFMAQGKYDDAEELVRRERINVDCPYEAGGMTALHMAALNDDVEGTSKLIAWGAVRDRRDERGKTALQYAREGGAQRVAGLLSGQGPAGWR